MAAERPDLQSLEWHFKIVNRRGGGSEMQHRIDRAVDVQIVDDVVLHELESGIAQQMRNIVRAAGTEIVHTEDFEAHLDKAIAQVTSQESSPACDDSSHTLPTP